MSEWAQTWARGEVSDWVAAEWTQTMVRPLFKGNAVGIRPVLCSECLLKFAAACMVRSTEAELTAAVGDFQYGFGGEKRREP